MQIHIKATNINLTTALRQYVEEKVEQLAKYDERIIEVRAEIDLTTHHHHKGKIFRAEFNVRVPGQLLRVEKTAEDMYKAIDKVKEHMALMLKGHKEKLRDRHRRTPRP